MVDSVLEVLDRIEAQQRAQQRELAANAPTPANALDFLLSIYRNPLQPLPVRIRAAVEALPFESPKLSATAVFTTEDFAERLERAIARSGTPKNIDAKAIALPHSD